MGDVRAQAERARAAAAETALLARAAKDAALHAMADALVSASSDVLAANARDVERGRTAGLTDALVDRLTLTSARVEAMAQGLRDLAALPDPVGEVVRGSTLANGLQIRQVRVPICGSETLGGSVSYRQMLEAEAVDVVMLDLAWCGGLTEGRKIAALAT